MINNIFEITEIIGVASFALSGFLVGVRQKCDILGVTILSFLTALGGGIIRDVIVNKTPYSLTNILPISIVIAVIFLAVIFKAYKKENFDQKFIFIFTDSIGLVSFSITGTLIALGAGLNLFGVTLLAFLTAVGGGMIRDILINQVSFILNKELYGTVPVLIALCMYLLNVYHQVTIINMLIIFTTGVILRLFVYFKKINLPTLK